MMTCLPPGITAQSEIFNDYWQFSVILVDAYMSQVVQISFKRDNLLRK